jgi:mitotic-spindle organizing protein 1
MPSEADSKQDKHASAAQARQVIDVFHEISTLLVSFEAVRN